MSLITQSAEQVERQPSSVRLPESLRRQFRRLEGRLWKVETLAAGALGLGGILVSYLALFVSDRMWDTPVWLRCLILLTGLGTVVWTVCCWASDWTWRRRDLRAMSDLVQKRFRRLGDRLLGIVELANEAQRPAHFSPELYRAAIEQVSRDAEQYDFCEAVSVQTARRRLAGTVALFFTTLFVLFILPAASLNAFSRWAAPMASIPRYTLVALENLAVEQVVPHGEPFIIKGSVRYRTFWKPGAASGRFENLPTLRSPVSDGRVEFKVAGQVRSGIFIIRAGDAKQMVAIRPLHRPSLKEFAASIELPEYLRYPVVTQAVQGASLTLVEGSRATYSGKTTRELASATLATETGERESLHVTDSGFSTPPLTALGTLEFNWQDKFGLRSAMPWRLAIETQHDQPPTPELTELPRETSMLESEVLELKLQARDDFGVRDMGLLLATGGDESQTKGTVRSRFKADAPSPRETKFAERFGFSPRLLNIPPDSSIELKAYARDFFPNREPVESAVYRIHVLGNERHAEMVRQALESLLARLEEVTRLEEKIAAGTEELKELPSQELAEKPSGDRVGAVQEEQLQNARHLEQLTREGAQTLREAMRNPLVPGETLQEWTKNLQQMQQLSQQQMRQAADSLKAAQKQPDERAEHLAEALQKEQEALQQLAQMQQNVNKGLDQLQAMTLAQRLRKLGSEEKQLEERLQKNIGETIGLTPQELPERFRKSNAVVATNQSNVQTEATGLQSEISRFFERTQRSEYGTVNKEMAEARPGEQLEKVASFIQQNIAMEAMQNLAQWSDRFAQWADKLEPKRESDAGSGSGSGAAGQDERAEKIMKTLVSLLRLRGTETNLREQTRLLDERKEEGVIYHYNADLLSNRERESAANLRGITQGNVLAMLEPILSDTFGSMKQVMDLLGKPETGTETRGAQTKTVDLLSDAINLINEQAQRQESQNSSLSQEMSFLMQMMAQAPGQAAGTSPNGFQAGANRSGGSTDQQATATPGDASGKIGEGRNVQKASGFSGNVPAEFRDALESYFKALERQGE